MHYLKFGALNVPQRDTKHGKWANVQAIGTAMCFEFWLKIWLRVKFCRGFIVENCQK